MDWRPFRSELPLLIAFWELHPVKGGFLFPEPSFRNENLRESLPHALRNYNPWLGRSADVRSGPYVGSVNVVVGDAVIEPDDKKYTINRDDQTDLVIEQKNRVLDFVPRLIVDDEDLTQHLELSWPAYLWCLIPILMVIGGGLLGGGIGIPAAYYNLHLYRKTESTAKKYLLTGGVSVGAFLTYLIAAVLVNLLLP